MSVDDIAKRFAARLDRQVATSEARVNRASEELGSLFRQADRTQELAAERMNRSVRTDVRPFVNAQVSLGNLGILQQVDALMWQAFGLTSVAAESPLRQYPVVYSETLEEFFKEFLADEEMSETVRNSVLQHWVREAEQGAHKGGIWGVNLPGRGCYLNGWLYGKAAPLFGASAPLAPRDALQDARTFPHILETVCHEKLGHGFISDLTAMGQEKRRLGLSRFDLAQQHALRIADSPHSALLRQKHALIFQTSVFTEEGWSTWIAPLTIWLAGRQGLLSTGSRTDGPAAVYGLEALGSFLVREQQEMRGEMQELLEAFAGVLQLLLVDTGPVRDDMVLKAINALHALPDELDEACRAAFGQTTRYVLGYLLLRRLESQLGWRNVPYAVMIATSVTYDLDTISVSDLHELLLSNPQLNVDARLALLARLSLEPGDDHRVLARRAREELNLAVPEGW